MSRSLKHDNISEVKLFTENLDNDKVRKFSNRNQTKELIEESKEINTMQKIPFERISAIQFCVDSAIGLPLSTTATRVTARLLDHDKRQVGEPSASSISQPDSEAYAPVFDLHAGWRGKALVPTITVVCRIDTLEKPNLQPRCIGFAALKIAIDEHGLQPDPSYKQRQHYSKLYLNAGEYLLPIVYGSVPSDQVFTESVMDKLPHIYGAYLKVKLFDPNNNSKNKESEDFQNNNPLENIPTTPSKNHDSIVTNNINGYHNKIIISETSVFFVLLKCLSFHMNNKLPPIPIDSVLLNDIKNGLEIEYGEKKMIIRNCNEWLVHIFPPVHQKIPAISSRYMLKYEHNLGALVALDMLYNMPNRSTLIKSALEGLDKLKSNRGYFTKVYDNKIICFKTYFRYLCGSLIPKKLKGTEFVIDDASMELDFYSNELCPVYLDTFSRTAGFELSPNACLLVVVTAVDILTLKTATKDHPTSYFNTIPTKPFSKSASISSSTPIKDNNLFSDIFERDKRDKLQGLVGLYLGNDDTNATWWGIVPLIVTNSPGNLLKNQKPIPISRIRKPQHEDIDISEYNSIDGGSSSSSNNVDNVDYCVNNWVDENINNTSAQSPKFTPNSYNNVTNNQFVSPLGSLNSFVSTNSKNNTTNNTNNNLTRKEDNEEITYFVNAGTHQIPLFEGIPPESLVRSSNPFAWLLTNITAMEREKAMNSTKKSYYCSSNSSNVAIDNNKKGAPIELKLSPGASAFVNIIDPRLQRLSNESISNNSNNQPRDIPIIQDTLLKLLRIYSSNIDKSTGKLSNHNEIKYKKLYSIFEYNSLKHNKIRIIKDCIPKNIMKEVLFKEVNEKFTQKMSESY